MTRSNLRDHDWDDFGDTNNFYDTLALSTESYPKRQVLHLNT